MLTKPITFAGNQLLLNVSTSAAGSVRIEIQDLASQPLPGFVLADCHEVYGDDLERTVARKGHPDLGTLAGQPVRLRFEVRDADLYSFRFQQRQQLTEEGLLVRLAQCPQVTWIAYQRAKTP